MRKLWLLVFLILVSGCGAVKQDIPENALSINIDNFAFTPANIEINKGDTVTWINNDDAPHTVTFNGFSSETLVKGGSYKHTFNDLGDFDYYCKLHPSMKGKVIVK